MVSPTNVYPVGGISVAARLNRLPVIRAHRAAVVIVGIGIAMALVIADITAFGPKTTGQSLEQVNAGAEQGQPAGGPLPSRAARP
jgi:hypothetical protein